MKDMKDKIPHLHDIIRKQLQSGNLDLLGIVPISNHSDKMVRLRTLEEIVDEFESTETDGAVGYFLQVRPRRAEKQPEIASLTSSPSPTKSTPDNLYLANGKLNIPFLFKNADLLLESGDYTLARNIYRVILKTGEYTSKALFRLAKCFEF